jgi:hypothetical protein
VAVSLDAAVLGLSPKKAMDAETGEGLDFGNGRLRISMPGYGYRMVVME